MVWLLYDMVILWYGFCKGWLLYGAVTYGEVIVRYDCSTVRLLYGMVVVRYGYCMAWLLHGRLIVCYRLLHIKCDVRLNATLIGRIVFFTCEIQI